MYCLTCPEMPWRRPAAEARFVAQNLDVEFFEGIHAPTLGISARLTPPGDWKQRMSDRHVGQYLSHLMLWQRCLDRTDDTVLIFEDDVELVSNFRAELEQSMAALPSDWEIAYVSNHEDVGGLVRKVNDRVRNICYPICTHAVLYKQRALPAAIARMRQICNQPLPGVMAAIVLPYRRAYTFVPSLTTQPRLDAKTRAGSPDSGYWEDLGGWFDFPQVYDAQLARIGDAHAIFVEVGSWLGKSTAYMAEQIKRNYKKVKFVAVDTWKGTAHEECHQPVIRDAGGDLFTVWQQNMSRAGVLPFVRPMQLPSVEAAARFPDRSVDFIFIDAAHAYEAVKADIQAWRPKVRPGGVIAGHDFEYWEGVKRAVEEEFPGRFRVWQGCWIVD
jgi:SAM-dependent methyltransferase